MSKRLVEIQNLNKNSHESLKLIALNQEKKIVQKTEEKLKFEKNRLKNC